MTTANDVVAVAKSSPLTPHPLLLFIFTLVRVVSAALDEATSWLLLFMDWLDELRW